jgi:HPt (histidine-containing phosphotransfer) domain-containing protein
MFFQLISGFVWQIAGRDLKGMTVVKSQKLQAGAIGAPLDCVVLDVPFLNLNTYGDLALRAEILNLFLSQLDAVENRLQMPMDAKSWGFLTHTLKGAAAAVGARQLAALADNWGQRPHPASGGDRQALGAELKDALVAFKRAAQAVKA